jgi:hypothetical protein
MVSNVAVLRNLTFQKAGAGSATDIQAWPRLFLEIEEGDPFSMPEYRGRDGTTPYVDGQYAGVWRPHRLGILLRGQVAGAGGDEDAQRADTATARQQVYDLFEGRLVGILSVDDEGGTTWTINARPEAIVWGNHPVPTWRPVMVRLIAIDPPYWEATGS